jgi:hypothetical protein
MKNNEMNFEIEGLLSPSGLVLIMVFGSAGFNIAMILVAFVASLLHH